MRPLALTVCARLVSVDFRFHHHGPAASPGGNPMSPMWPPRSQEAVQMMLKLADVKKSDVVYDLACGDVAYRHRRPEDLWCAWRRYRH